MTRAGSNIYLIGPTGSGKTAVGRQLARDAGLRFFDSDHEIEQRTGVEIAYIFEKEGEAGFRERESEMLRELASLEGAVVATGGGAVLARSNRDLLASTGTVVYLRTTVAEQLKRTGRSRKRPLLNRGNAQEVLEEMARLRQPLYEEIADVELDTSRQKVRTVARELGELLRERGILPLQT